MVQLARARGKLPMRTAYSYRRYSSPEQSKGDSLRRQTAESQALSEKHGWILDDTLHLQDLGMSAFKGKNAREGALAGFLESIKTGRVKRGSILIVESLDRLSRDDIDEALTLFMGIIRSGVDIATTKPERIYDRTSIKNPMYLLEPLFIFARANEESATKASRLQAAWDTKRKNIKTTKLTSRCPAWLTIAPDHRRFVFVPANAAIVKRICTMALAGHGATHIAKVLNQEGVPCVGREKNKGWARAYIQRILHSRSLIGEYQPHRQRRGETRTPTGDAIPDYFPMIISKRDFYRIQSRFSRNPGRQGIGTPNLFTGILFDARDGASMTLVQKSGHQPKSGQKIANSAAQRGVNGAQYITFTYQVLEALILKYLPEVRVQDVAEPRAETNVAEYEAELADLDYRIGVIKKRLAIEKDLEPLMDSLSEFAAQRAHTQALLEQFTWAGHQQTAEQSLHDVRQLVKLDITDEATRRALKIKIRQLVHRIEVHLERKGVMRFARVTMIFGSGKHRTLGIVLKGGKYGGEYWHRWIDGDKPKNASEYYAWADRLR
jgi:DNA invertase Pin-like site-specific DNA recombinase